MSSKPFPSLLNPIIKGNIASKYPIKLSGKIYQF